MVEKQIKAKNVIGVTVKENNLNKIGHISEIILDKTTGKVSYIIEKDNQQTYQIPWHLVHYDLSNDCFILKINKENLKKILENEYDKIETPVQN